MIGPMIALALGATFAANGDSPNIAGCYADLDAMKVPQLASLCKTNATKERVHLIAEPCDTHSDTWWFKYVPTGARFKTDLVLHFEHGKCARLSPPLK